MKMTIYGKLIVLGLGLVLFTEGLFAQAKPDYFPDDVDANVSSAQIRCLCKPGVRNKSRSKGLEISYDLAGRGTYESESETFTAPYTTFSRWQRLKVSLKAPVIYKEGLKLLVGYRFFGESVTLSQVGSDYKETFEAMNKGLLKSHSLSLLFSKSINEKQYMVLRFRNSVNGNYSGLKLFDQRYNIYKGLAMYGVKPNEDFEWGIGLSFSTGFRNRTSALPFVLYNRNFNNKWAIESALPAFIFVRRNLNSRSLLLAGVEFSGQSYRLGVSDAQSPLDYAYNHSAVLASVQMDRRITEWVWANIKFGYQFNFSSDFQTQNQYGVDFQVEPTNAFFLRIGLFLSPPKRYIK